MPADQTSGSLKTLSMNLLNRVKGFCSHRRVVGMGTDLVEVNRMQGQKGRSIASSILTENEWAACSKLKDQSMGWSCVWACRESAYKAFSGFHEISPLLWECLPIGKDHWRPVPKKPDGMWSEFQIKHDLDILVDSDSKMVLALAIASKKLQD